MSQHEFVLVCSDLVWAILLELVLGAAAAREGRDNIILTPEVVRRLSQLSHFFCTLCRTNHLFAAETRGWERIRATVRTLQYWFQHSVPFKIDGSLQVEAINLLAR